MMIILVARDVGRIEAAFSRVKESTEKSIGGGESSKDEALQDIFELNNEIGRLARTEPRTMGKMRELQAYVNMITVGIKYGKTESLREGLLKTEESLGALRGELRPSSSSSSTSP